MFLFHVLNISWAQRGFSAEEKIALKAMEADQMTGGRVRCYWFPGWRVYPEEWCLALKISIKLWTGSPREVAQFPLEV